MKALDIKKTLNLKRLMLAVAMTACVVSHAFAAAPKADTAVMHDQITLGDVFDGVQDNAGYVLAPAPALGRSVTLNAQDLTRISDAFSLGWTPDNALQHVTIRRAASAIDSYDIQAALQKKMAAELRGKKIEIELSDRSVGFPVPENTDKALTVEHLMYKAVEGTFSAVVSVAALPGMKKEVKGRFYRIDRLPVLKEPHRPGDILAADDIDYIDLRATAITPTMIVDASNLIGQTPRRGIPAMKPVLTGDVHLPMVVKKGDLVTMVLNNARMSLTAQGRALDNGSEGDAIRVMNTSSKQVLDATVTGAQTVTVKTPSGALSMNTL